MQKTPREYFPCPYIYTVIIAFMRRLIMKTSENKYVNLRNYEVTAAVYDCLQYDCIHWLAAKDYDILLIMIFEL